MSPTRALEVESGIKYERLTSSEADVLIKVLKSKGYSDKTVFDILDKAAKHIHPHASVSRY